MSSFATFICLHRAISFGIPSLLANRTEQLINMACYLSSYCQLKADACHEADSKVGYWTLRVWIPMLLFMVGIFSCHSHSLLRWSIKKKKRSHQEKVKRSFGLLRMLNTHLCNSPCAPITWGMILGYLEYKPICQTTRAYLWHCGTLARVFSVCRTTMREDMCMT